MTLKEKMYFDCTLNTDEQAEKNVKVAEEFAIEFVKWLRYNCVEIDYGWQNHGKQYSDDEILKLFKEEKGL